MKFIDYYLCLVGFVVINRKVVNFSLPFFVCNHTSASGNFNCLSSHGKMLAESFQFDWKENIFNTKISCIWRISIVPKNDPKFRGGYIQKNREGVCGTLPKILTLFQTKICDFPYPISDLIKNLIPYFRPEALEPGAWLKRVTSCYGTYTVVGVNIKREMVLSPNDEEVANSSKKHTQFKTRVHKRYPISDQNS